MTSTAQIGVLFGIQGEGLAAALRLLLPLTRVTAYDRDRVLTDSDYAANTAASLRRADIVISCDMPLAAGPCATAILREECRLFCLLPPLQFAGFHPDAVQLRLDSVPLPGPTGLYHSRIAILAFLARLSEPESAALYTRLSFERLGYFDTFSRERDALLARMDAYGIDFASLFDTALSGGHFMMSPDHPKPAGVLALARAVCEKMGLSTEPVPPSLVPDAFASLPSLPFFAALADRLGLPPETGFRPESPAPGRASPRLDTLSYLRAAFASLRRIPRLTLMQADGVSEGLAALNLAAMPAPPAEPPEPDAIGFLSGHGTVIRVDTASSMLLQMDPRTPVEGCTDLFAVFGKSDDGIRESAAFGGVRLIPAEGDLLYLARGGLFLAAPPGNLRVTPTPEAREAFLPVTQAELASLTELLSRDWHVNGIPCPAPLISLAPSFQLRAGAAICDLRRVRPQPDGSGGFELRDIKDHAVHFTPAAGLSRPGEYVLSAPAALAECGSTPEFRMTPNAAIMLRFPVQALHPPLTVSNADRDWLFATARLDPWPMAQERSLHLRRAAARVVIATGQASGTIFGPRTAPTLDRYTNGVTDFRDEGVRVIDGTWLAGPAAIDAAPLIAGPVFVPDFWPDPVDFGALISLALQWIAAEAHAPPGTRLLLPFSDEGADWPMLLENVGLRNVPVIAAPAPLCRVETAIWLQQSEPVAFPASTLLGLQRRIDAASALRPRIVVSGPAMVSNETWTILNGRGYRSPEGADLPSSFNRANWIVGTPDSLVPIVFCRLGTRLIVLCSRDEFDISLWQIAETLNLRFLVLPCDRMDDGRLSPDPNSLHAALEMLRWFKSSVSADEEEEAA